MRLVYHREPNEVAFQFFWVNPQNQRTSPVFYTEDEAKQWLTQGDCTMLAKLGKREIIKQVEWKKLGDMRQFTGLFDIGLVSRNLLVFQPSIFLNSPIPSRPPAFQMV